MTPGPDEPAGPIPGGGPPDADELAEDAKSRLREHLAARADEARERHGTLTADGVDAFLEDARCVRRPHRLVFGSGERSLHQFAQPGADPEGTGQILWVHPALRDRPDLLPLAVAYLVPVINYGEELVDDEACLEYAARLFGWSTDECYRRVCALAEELELAEARTTDSE